MKIRLVGAQLFHAARRTDRQTDRQTHPLDEANNVTLKTQCLLNNHVLRTQEVSLLTIKCTYFHYDSHNE